MECVRNHYETVKNTSHTDFTFKERTVTNDNKKWQAIKTKGTNPYIIKKISRELKDQVYVPNRYIYIYTIPI